MILSDADVLIALTWGCSISDGDVTGIVLAAGRPVRRQSC